MQKERLESVAEHVYGTQMLAIAMWSEYGYDIDLMKAIMMLAVHELEEVAIGDIIPFEMSLDEKKARGQTAVVEMLSGLQDGKKVQELFVEHYEQRTPEAKFAKWCDKLEADLQMKIYDEEGRVDMVEQEGNAMLMNAEVQEIAKGKQSAAEIWLEYNRQTNGYDENFLAVSRYAEQHKISA